jgi:calcium-translocating P-type ATPase
MCTGDNIDTACAISLDAGLVTKEELNVPDNEFNPSYVCMTGPNFYETVGGLYKTVDKDGKEKELIKNTNKFEKIASELKVLARSRPEDKYVLVTGLKQLGHVVAVTGDGTNDAPALSKSDIGFAMGIAGSDVAKNASDIILMDDNFCSVITAIKYGRNVFDSVRKFLQFQITVNVVAMFIVFSGSVIFSDPPLNSVQMLWVNLIMDTFAALALATEPPSQNLLDRAPEKRTDKIVNAVMWRNIFGQAIYQIVVLLVLLCCGQKWFKLDYPEGTPLVYS